MKWAVLAGWLARIVAIVLSLVNTRLLVEISGLGGLAVQAIVASLLTWVSLLSFGLPHGMQNLVSEWRVQRKDINSLRNTATSVTALLFVVLIPVGLGIAAFAHSFLLTSFAFVSFWGVAIALLLMVIMTVGNVFTQMLHAEHRSFWPNVYPAFTALGVCGVLLALKVFEQRDFNLLLALYFVPAACLVLLAIHQLQVPLRWHIDRDCLTELWLRSKGYLLVSFLGTLTLGLDYAILSQVLSESQIAAYSLVSRFFLVLLSIHAVLLASAWSTMGEMHYSGKFAELRRYILRLLVTGLALGGIGGGVVFIGLPSILAVLAGQAAPEVPLVLALMWWAYLLIRIWSDSYFAILQSFGRTDLLNRYIPFQAFISAGAQIVLGLRYGAEGIMAGMLLSFVLTCAWYLPRHVWKLTFDKAQLQQRS